MAGSALVHAARDAGVRDERVLAAVARVPREWFVLARERQRARLDEPLRIGHGQTTSQPSLIARILEDLRLEPGSRVLEVGAGFGYEAALVATLVAPGGSVLAIERDARLAGEARRRLARLRELRPSIAADLHVLVGDGMLGAPDDAPFDAIIVAARAGELPAALVSQLANGGRLVIPIDVGQGAQLTRFERLGPRVVATSSLGAVRYVPLLPGLAAARAAGGRPRDGRFSGNILQPADDRQA